MIDYDDDDNDCWLPPSQRFSYLKLLFFCFVFFLNSFCVDWKNAVQKLLASRVKKKCSPCDDRSLEQQ